MIDPAILETLNLIALIVVSGVLDFAITVAGAG